MNLAKERNKETKSHLQIIKKIAECVKVGYVNLVVWVWSLSVLKVLHHFSLYHKHFKLHPNISFWIPDVSVYIINISVCITNISTCDLTISRLPKVGRTGRSAGRVKSSSCVPTSRACYIAYKSAIVSMTKKRNLNNPSGKFSVEVICVSLGTRLRSNCSKNGSINIKLELHEIRKRTLKDGRNYWFITWNAEKLN